MEQNNKFKEIILNIQQNQLNQQQTKYQTKQQYLRKKHIYHNKIKIIPSNLHTQPPLLKFINIQLNKTAVNEQTHKHITKNIRINHRWKKIPNQEEKNILFYKPINNNKENKKHNIINQSFNQTFN